jgi:hypothetical protein
MLVYTSPGYRNYLTASMLKLLPSLVNHPTIDHCLQVITLNSMWFMATDSDDQIILGALADMLKQNGTQYFFDIR